MNGPVTDEQLVAFLHRELGAEAMSAVEAAINADPRLAERAEMLADQDIAIRDAFAPILAAEVPQHLHRIVETGPETAKIIDFGGAKARRTLPGWGLPQMGAMAASLALGLVAGYALVQASGGASDSGFALASGNGVRMGTGIVTVLSRTPSGQSVKLAGLGEVNVAVTFRATDNRVCRQFSMRSADQVDDALACRDGTDWKLEAFGRRQDAGGEMRTASGEAAAPIIVAVDELIAGEPLVGQAESDALR